MEFKLIQIPFELQPHFLKLIKSWKMAWLLIMAKHDGVQKDLARGEAEMLGEKMQRSAEREKEEKEMILLNDQKNAWAFSVTWIIAKMNCA